jgi:hypothetical protein
MAAVPCRQLGSVEFAKLRKHRRLVDVVAVAQLGKNVPGPNDSIL